MPLDSSSIISYICDMRIFFYIAETKAYPLIIMLARPLEEEKTLAGDYIPWFNWNWQGMIDFIYKTELISILQSVKTGLYSNLIKLKDGKLYITFPNLNNKVVKADILFTASVTYAI